MIENIIQLEANKPEMQRIPTAVKIICVRKIAERPIGALAFTCLVDWCLELVMKRDDNEEIRESP